MKFYCISQNSSDSNVTLLKVACQKHKIQFIRLDPDTFNIHLDDLDIGNNLLYRVSTSKKAHALELHLLLSASAPVSTIYKDTTAPFKHLLKETILFKKNGIAQPKTVPYIPTTKKLVMEIIPYLGGFPIIIKVLGGTLGVGVIKIDSESSLFSVLDYLKQYTSRDYVIMREFINHDEQARLTVLNGSVISSKCNTRYSKEFRLNVDADEFQELRTYSDTINNLAISAVDTLGFYFGAVDIIINKKTGEATVSEVNTPCDFSPAQKFTKVDIAEKLVLFLKNQ